MQEAIARWNDRRRRTLSKYREAVAKHDAWPETSVVIWFLAGLPCLIDVLGRPMIGAMGEELALVAVLAVWILGAVVVGVVASIWRRRKRAFPLGAGMGTLPLHLFGVIALLSWGFVVIGLTHVDTRWHGSGQRLLMWVTVIAAWLAGSYLLAQILRRTFQSVRERILRLY
jgi:hypothetical protein